MASLAYTRFHASQLKKVVRNLQMQGELPKKLVEVLVEAEGKLEEFVGKGLVTDQVFTK